MEANKYYNKVIKNVEFSEDELILKFSDNTSIRLFDGGQSCCERRYLTTDDNVSSLIGNKLTKVEIKDTSHYDDGDSVHEICFLEVATDKGLITISSHNEHNGYYGGIDLSVEEI